MIGLSVAIGRFVEALFWAIFRAVGAVAGAVLLVVALGVVTWMIGRRLLRRRR